MNNLPPALREAIEPAAKADERTHGVDTLSTADSVRFHKYWSFIHGAEFLFQLLLQAAPEQIRLVEAYRDGELVEQSVSLVEYVKLQAAMAALRAQVTEFINLAAEHSREGSTLAADFNFQHAKAKALEASLAAERATSARLQAIIDKLQHVRLK